MSGLVDQHGRPLQSVNYGYYKGTQRSRVRRAMVNEVSDSRNTLNRWSRELLLGYSRHLFTNIGEIRGMVKDVARYSVGRGIKPQSQAGDESKAYEQFFKNWADNCDIRGQHSFWQMQRLASVRADVDGDIGFNMISGANDWPFLQAIEGHQIKGPGKDENEFDGVVISPRTGRPVAYMISQKDGGHKRIPAGNFILVSDPERVAQYRGVTAMAHAITDTWDVSEILDYEKVGVKARSAIGMVIKTHSGDDDDAIALTKEGNDAATTGDVPWQSFDAGMIPRLLPDEDITDIGGNRPSPAFTGFLETLMRKVCVGYGLPFEFVWALAGANAASQRAILAKSQRVFDDRFDMLSRFNSRVWTWVIAKGIKRGDLKFTEDWYKVRWQQPKRITVDVGREAKENREDVKFGIKTIQAAVGEMGEDWEETRHQTERELVDLFERANRIAKQSNMPVTTVLEYLQQRSPNPVLQINDTSLA